MPKQATQPVFVCYAPRPVYADPKVAPFDRATLLVLRDARGIFRTGMRVSDLVLVMRHATLGSLRGEGLDIARITPQRVGRSLARLVQRGSVTALAAGRFRA